MNLYIFPEAACNMNGYGIAVLAAYKNLDIKSEDTVIWLTTVPKEKMLCVRPQDIIIKRNSLFSIKSFINTLKCTNRSELWVKDLFFLKNKSFNNIYCDDAIFYRAIRKLYPNQHLTIRLHNCFARIKDRLSLLQRNVDLKYRITLHNMYRLERDIFNDENVFKIFISDEDRLYYTSHYGKTSDSNVFDFPIDMEKAKTNRNNLSLDNRIIWYGGVESHKKSSIDWFISDVYPKIKKDCPNLEFHLWGKNTINFDNPSINIYGHGYYEGNGMPSKNSLYINPDIIGGGKKIKLASLIENGVRVISTPFGFEGYSHDIIDDKFCIVKEENNWAEFIINFLKQNCIK